MSVISALEKLAEELFGQKALNAIVAELTPVNVQNFLAGTFAGDFPTIHIHILGIPITFTDVDIKNFLTDLRNKDWSDMLANALVALQPSV